MINRFGVFFSCTEASKYCTNAETVQICDVTGDIGDAFVEFQVDNVDHASGTFDGYGSIHAMDQMTTYTPTVKSNRMVPRQTANRSDLKSIAHVQVCHKEI